MQAGVRDLGEVVVLIVVAHIVCQGVQGSVVAVCLLTLQGIATLSQQAPLHPQAFSTSPLLTSMGVCREPVSAS